MSVLIVRERDLLPFSGDGRLTVGQEHALRKLVTKLPAGALAWEHAGVRIGPFCGIIRADDLVIEILPKIEVNSTDHEQDRGVLVAMLRAVSELAISNAGTTPIGLQRLHLLDIFSHRFLCSRRKVSPRWRDPMLPGC